MKISVVVAVSLNRVIGKNGKLPWQKIPQDLKLFKEITMEQTVVMGRKTYESIGKALSGRINVVITSRFGYQAPNCYVVNSIEAALMSFCGSENEIFFIGGQEIFTQILPKTDKVYMSLIQERFSGDTYFPEFNFSEWNIIERKKYKKDEKNPHDFSFIVFEKIKFKYYLLNPP